MTEPNAEQIKYWNEEAGPRWLAADAVLGRVLAPLGDMLVERAAVKEGEQILDVGCGTARTSIELARRVGPRGSVLGVDISAPLLDRAREHIAKEKLANVGVTLGDAQTHAFERESFDLVFSRFGVMFFADPVAAFSNLARATRAGGRLLFVCWQPMDRNAWVRDILGAVSKHIALPPPPPPGSPGPFAFGDGERTRGILESAGYRNVRVEPFEMSLRTGTDVEEATRFATEVGPSAKLLHEAEPEARERAVAEIRELCARGSTPDGVMFTSAVWFVGATR